MCYVTLILLANYSCNSTFLIIYGNLRTFIQFFDTHAYSLQNKVKMMKDELDHKRQLDLAQVTKVPTAVQPIPVKHNVCMHVHNNIYIVVLL